MKPIRTTFAGPKNPFTGEPKVKMTRIDPTKIEIGNDQMPAHRASPNKYNDLFGRLKPGQCLICESDQAAKLSTALKKYIASTQQHSNCIVRSTSRFDDGRGRVWLIALPAAKVKRVA